MALKAPAQEGSKILGSFKEVPSGGGEVAAAAGNAVNADISGILTIVVDLIKISATSVAIMTLIIGGYLWMFARGDKEKISNANKFIGGSVLGLVCIGLIDQVQKVLNFKGIAQVKTVSDLINHQEVVRFINQIVIYLEMGVAIAVTTAIIVSGFKYITATSDDQAQGALRGIAAAAGGMFFIGVSRFIVIQMFGAGSALNIQALAFQTNKLIADVINFSLELSALIAVAMIIYAGFQLLISGGEKGGKTAMHAIIGLIVMLLSYGGVRLILSLV